MSLIKLTLLSILITLLCYCHTKHSKQADLVNSEIGTSTAQNSIDKQAILSEYENSQAIELVVKQILTTSPRYIKLTQGLQKKLIKNGGLYLGVSLKINPKQDEGNRCVYASTYDLTLYEMYAERRLNTSRFLFNPKNEQLLEYDIFTDSLVAIDFDRELLVKYDSLKKTWNR